MKSKMIAGQKFGQLTTLKVSHTKNGAKYWLFKCDCGKEKVVRLNEVTSYRTRSCGCLKLNQWGNRGY